jgi:hypothetical protein
MVEERLRNKRNERNKRKLLIFFVYFVHFVYFVISLHPINRGGVLQVQVGDWRVDSQFAGVLATSPSARLRERFQRRINSAAGPGNRAFARARAA